MSTAEPTHGLEVLAFGPHPDDVELFCGGLLATLAGLGHRTGIVDLTRGEKSSRGTPETRAAETEAASRMLGLTVRENLGLPDGWIDPWAGFEVPEAERARTAPVARVVEVLRRLRPELVLVPWQHERHPDHEATSALVTRALFFASVRKFETDPSSAPFTPRQVLYYPMRHLAEPSFVVDVTAAHDQKMAAIRCYASQVEARVDGPQTLVGSPLSLTSLEARDRFYGARIGVSHGEPYVLRETLGLTDPVEHFRRNSFARPLFFPGPR
ncbi:bacillithiol biosynthesis deacetylase BshB1 [Stigmatella aurantiaca]|uniref:N-acetylglucosaminyl phosphatidylinositol deacetylase n=1 Tax=Stigmatella aurantiaca (strain DW4/3-1) TaxID=378806 RepID=Q092G3_STIAD|nr:bacillithiol biosynthesis deacetylase BshB1 [Stigmatella aurantiaca]ADO69697.1 N-acetylglucosaminyl phosphatidylinositol deacetylase [Stigmatella aurantiaca DW4/3-1]EAU66601.1 YpjG [Stigmatella aurantiaca DW4/3-1]